ncbi:MAG: hypothetical protein AB1758_09240 [Candidatus Eremiobacterota bacterium]
MSWQELATARERAAGASPAEAAETVRQADRAFRFQFHSDSTREEATRLYAGEFSGTPAGPLFLELAGPIAPDWAARLTRAIAAPAGKTTLEERRRAAGCLGLEQRKQSLTYHGAKLDALAAFRAEVERGLTPDEATRCVGAFVDEVPGPSGVDRALQDYVALKLWQPVPRQLYLKALSLGFSAEWPGRWTGLLQQPLGDSRLKDRVAWLEELCSSSPVQLHARKVEAFELVGRRIRDGLTFEQARDEVRGFLAALAPDRAVQPEPHSPLANYSRLGLEDPVNRGTYVALANRGYAWDWPERILEALKLPCGDLAQVDRLKAFERLAGEFRLPPTQLALYQLYRARTGHSEDPEGECRALAAALRPRKLEPLMALNTLAETGHDPATVVARIEQGFDPAEAALGGSDPEFFRLACELPQGNPEMRWDALQAYQLLLQQGTDPVQARRLVASMADSWYPGTNFRQLVGESLRVAQESPAQGVRLSHGFVQVGPVRVARRRSL